jgi:hypothetical protein
MRRDAGYNFMRLVNDATRVDELHGIESPAAGVTLISACILKVA